MLCSANFNGQHFFFGGWFRNGTFSDFNTAWFDTFGDTLVGSMRFNCYYPIASEIAWYSIRLAKRLWDKLFVEEGHETKCVTI